MFELESIVDSSHVYKALAPALATSSCTLTSLSIQHRGSLVSSLSDLVISISRRNFHLQRFVLQFLNKDGSPTEVSKDAPAKVLEQIVRAVGSSNASALLVGQGRHHTVRMVGRKLTVLDFPLLRLGGVGCTKLTALYADDNEITKIDAEIASLVNLKTLSLRNNQLSELPLLLGKLESLTDLNVSSNNITALPSSLILLTNLQKLDVKYNRISVLPRWLPLLPQLATLRVEGNPITVASSSDSASSTLSTLRSAAAVERAVEYHAKVVFVGKGNSGKSTLLRCLRLMDENGKVRPKDSKRLKKQNVATDGVEVAHWEVLSISETDLSVPVTLHTYDFAGQSLYYGTHQYFMTPQSFYVLVVGLDEPIDESYVNYWMDAIKHTGGGSPAFLVATKADLYMGTPEELRGTLSGLVERVRRHHPNVLRVCVVSGVTGNGVKALLTHLVQEICTCSWSKWFLPAKFTCIVDRLLAYRIVHENPILLWSDFRTMVQQYGVEGGEIEVLVRFMCVSGLFVKTDALQEDLRTLLVLDVPWLTRLLCTVVTLQHHFVTKGILKVSFMRSLLRSVLSGAMQSFTMELLELFDVAYALPDEASSSRLAEVLLGECEIPSSPQLQRKQSGPKLQKAKGDRALPRNLTSPASITVERVPQDRPSLAPQCNNTSKPRYLLIPYLLPEMEPPPSVLKEWEGGVRETLMASPDTYVYVRVYEFSFLPMGFFHRLVVRLLASDVWRPSYVWRKGIIMSARPFTTTGAAVRPRSGFQSLARQDSLLMKILMSSMTSSQRRSWLGLDVDHEAERVSEEVRGSVSQRRNSRLRIRPSSGRLPNISSAEDSGSTTTTTPGTTDGGRKKGVLKVGASSLSAPWHDDVAGVSQIFLSFDRNRLTLRVTGPGALYTLLYCTQELESLMASASCPVPKVYIPCPDCVVAELHGFRKVITSAREVAAIGLMAGSLIANVRSSNDSILRIRRKPKELGALGKQTRSSTAIGIGQCSAGRESAMAKSGKLLERVDLEWMTEFLDLLEGQSRSSLVRMCTLQPAAVNAGATSTSTTIPHSVVVLRCGSQMCVWASTGSPWCTLLPQSNTSDVKRGCGTAQSLLCAAVQTPLGISSPAIFLLPVLQDRAVCVLHSDGSLSIWKSDGSRMLASHGADICTEGNEASVSAVCASDGGEKIFICRDNGILFAVDIVDTSTSGDGDLGDVTVAVRDEYQLPQVRGSSSFQHCAIETEERIFLTVGQCLVLASLQENGAQCEVWGEVKVATGFSSLLSSSEFPCVWAGDTSGQVCMWQARYAMSPTVVVPAEVTSSRVDRSVQLSKAGSVVLGVWGWEGEMRAWSGGTGILLLSASLSRTTSLHLSYRVYSSHVGGLFATCDEAGQLSLWLTAVDRLAGSSKRSALATARPALCDSQQERRETEGAVEGLGSPRIARLKELQDWGVGGGVKWTVEASDCSAGPTMIMDDKQVTILSSFFFERSTTPTPEEEEELLTVLTYACPSNILTTGKIHKWFAAARGELGKAKGEDRREEQEFDSGVKNVGVHQQALEPSLSVIPLPYWSMFDMASVFDSVRRRKHTLKCSNCHHAVHVDRIAPDVATTIFDDGEFVMDDLEGTAEIGSGGYAVVYRAIYRGKEVAVKVISEVVRNQSVVFTDFRKEVWIMRMASHSCVLPLLGTCRAPLAIMMEYMNKGDLHTYLHSHSPGHVPLRVQFQLAMQVALGMEYLHSRSPSILHLDLRSYNVLLAQDSAGNLQAKVSDFGKAHYITFGSAGGNSTAALGIENCIWMAPEVLACNVISKKADVYSFAIVLWEIVTQEEPFADSSWMSVLERSIVEGARPALSERVPSALAEFMRECWHQDPAIRPEFTTIVQRLGEMCVVLTGTKRFRE